MTTMISIDPGARTGWAVWRDGTLVACGACAPQSLPLGPYDECVIEWPRERRGGHASVASLVTLGAHAGEALGRIGATSPRRVDPSEWKGQVPKPERGGNYIIARRVDAALREGEPAPAWLVSDFDTWDAIGLGLWALGRVRRGCV